jgi:1,4-dihydroxy-2-naphthoate octaprenyltransferase
MRMGFKPVVLLPLGLAPLAWRHAQLLATAQTPAELISLLGDTGKLLALYAILLSAGLLA